MADQIRSKSTVSSKRKTYTKPVGFDTMSLLTLRPFLGIALVPVLAFMSSYLGPATTFSGGGEGALQSSRDGEGVGIMAKRS